MMANLMKLKWDVLPHPPHRPDIALYDYHLSGPMKGSLGGKRFQTKGEVIATVQCWIHFSLKWELRSFQNVGTSVLQSMGATLKSSV
jgi:hypothetical protein